MTSPRPNYRNPPIVEAVVEFRFEDARRNQAQSAELLQRFHRALGPEFPSPPRTQHNIQVRAVDADPSSNIAALQARSDVAMMFPSLDNKKVVGVGRNKLSFHVLAPYPGWEDFLNGVRHVRQLYYDVIKPPALLVIGIRYIDKILIPPNISLSEFFHVLPLRPKSMPEHLSAFHVVLESSNTDTDMRALMTLSSIESDVPEKLAVLYDLNLECLDSTVLQDWELQLQRLHEKQRDIFEDSITDRMREIFNA